MLVFFQIHIEPILVVLNVTVPVFSTIFYAFKDSVLLLLGILAGQKRQSRVPGMGASEQVLIDPYNTIQIKYSFFRLVLDSPFWSVDNCLRERMQ